MRTIFICLLLTPLVISSQIKFTPGSAALTPTPFHSGSVIGISDMNADGLDDIVRLEKSQYLSIEYQSSPGRNFIHRDFGRISEFDLWNVSLADINKDGYTDMVFTADLNNGYVFYSKLTGGKIEYDVAVLEGSRQVYSQAANLVDINNDGWIDYFVCSDEGVNKIWANHGGHLSGLPVSWIDFNIPNSDGSGNYGSVWTDVDNDGDLDLYIAKCKFGVSSSTDPRRINVLYKNFGNGVFKEVAPEANLAIGEQSWVAAAGDCDNDGDIDFFVLNHHTASNLMINDGRGIFKDTISTSGIQYSDDDRAIGIQAVWSDLDNDGLLDLLISGTSFAVYINKGNNTFEAMDTRLFGTKQIESFAIGDLNHDGKQDIYASYANLFNEASYRPDEIWLNNTTNQNHFIDIRLVGTTSTGNGVGSRISLYANGTRQTREVYAGMSYGISSTLTQHFGIGTATKIDSIVVRWQNGLIEKIESPFIDRTLLIKQGTCFAFDPILNAPSLHICHPGDSVVLSSPFAGDYLWSNGATDRTITVTTPGNYQVKIKNAQGCDVYSNMVAIDGFDTVKYKITLQDSVICRNANTVALVNTDYKIKWNTGDTGRTVTIDKAGKYFATIQGACSQLLSDTVTVRQVFQPDLIVKNDSVALSAKATLTAQGNSVYWYSNPTDTKPIAAGTTFITGGLTESKTYYAQSVISTPGPLISGGLKDYTGDSKFAASSFSGKLYFDVLAPCILKSVKVYCDTPGTREIDLVDINGNIINSKLIKLAAGESRVNLNFVLDVGTNYSLGTNDTVSLKVLGTISPQLYRTPGIIPYPLISGPIVIVKSSFNDENYYSFYDWQIAYPDLVCFGDRVPVKAVVKTTSIQHELNDHIHIFPNPAMDRVILQTDGSVNIHHLHYQLINQLGQTMNEITNLVKTGHEVMIDVQKPPSGLYYLKLEYNGKYGIFPIVKL